jgi:preprotein translocase subunit SecF/SecD/SecF fusion protein
MGVVIGTYSSIFIAAPLLGYLGVKRDWSDGAAKTVAAGKASKTKAKV